MERDAGMSPKLKQLLDQARTRTMTQAERERQVVSLAYGNVKLENDRVTRPQVEHAVHAAHGIRR